MKHINKPLEIRTQLGLTPTEAGRLLLGIDNGKRAYDTWAKMETANRDTKSLSNGMEQYLNLLLFMVMCRDHKTPGADKALDLFIELQKAV